MWKYYKLRSQMSVISEVYFEIPNPTTQLVEITQLYTWIYLSTVLIKK